MAASGTSGSRSWALPALVVAMVILPIAEIWLIIQVGQAIGALATVAILIAEAFLGAWLLRREGSKAWAALMGAITRGAIPTGELADAALVLVGGICLMLPGFFTDIFGLLFLLPFTRPLARTVLALFAARSVAKRGIDLNLLRPQSGTGAVIPGEVVPDVVVDDSSSPRHGDVIRGEIEP